MLRETVFLAAIVSATVSLAATMQVPGDFATIQAAIDAAVGGDVVLVAPGEYVITEPVNFNRLHRPTDPASPPVKNIELRSAHGANLTTLRMAAPPKNPARASVIIFENGETATSMLVGFTLTGGRGTLLAKNAKPLGNVGGGILCLNGSSPTVTDCTIAGNHALPGEGGGICCSSYSSPTIRNCTISGNSASMTGGGICCNRGSSPSLENCTIFANAADEAGGGIYALRASSPVCTSCSIVYNAASDGAGVWVRGDGAFPGQPTSSPTFANCTIAGNLSTGSGSGAYFNYGAKPVMRNCTIVDNTALAPDGSAIVASVVAVVSVVNCIVWYNHGVSLDRDAAFINARFSCVEGGSPGEGNLDQDPFLLARGQRNDNGTPDDLSDDTWIPGNYRLDPSSPCRDTGLLLGAPNSDCEGFPRPCGGGVDMGAYEFGECLHSAPIFVRGDATNDGLVGAADVLLVLGFLFTEGPRPTCIKAADTNDDGKLDIADPIALLTHLLFAQAGPLPAPTGACGVDPTTDALGCGEYPPCRL